MQKLSKLTGWCSSPNRKVNFQNHFFFRHARWWCVGYASALVLRRTSNKKRF